MKNTPEKRALDKLDVSRKFIMRNQAFFASIMLGLDVQQDDKVETMATNGKNLLWCADFVANQCDQNKVSFITNI